jgi:hypothetical protein
MARGMTERSFDELARGLASGDLSRREALKLMGAALLGGTLASLGFGGVAAADPKGCRRNGEPCKRDRQCCSGDCSSHGRCVGGAPGAGCAQPGESCITQQDCCFGGGIPSCNSGRCCRVIQQGCTQNSDCCTGHCINNGCTRVHSNGQVTANITRLGYAPGADAR